MALERGYVTQEWAAKQEVNLASIAARLAGNKQPKRSKKSESDTVGMADLVVAAVLQQVDEITNVSDSVALNEETPSAPSAITMTSTTPQSQNEASCDPAGSVLIDVMEREEESRAVRAITLTSSVTMSADDTSVIEGQLAASPGGKSVRSVQEAVSDLNNQTNENASDIQIDAPNIMNSPDPPPNNSENEASVQSVQSVQDAGDVHGVSTPSVHSVALPVGVHQVTLPAGVASTISEEMLQHYVYAAQQHVWGQYQQVFPTAQSDVNESK